MIKTKAFSVRSQPSCETEIGLFRRSRYILLGRRFMLITVTKTVSNGICRESGQDAVVTSALGGSAYYEVGHADLVRSFTSNEKRKHLDKDADGTVELTYSQRFAKRLRIATVFEDKLEKPIAAHPPRNSNF